MPRSLSDVTLFYCANAGLGLSLATSAQVRQVSHRTECSRAASLAGGFTLVELLIVLAVMAILAAIAVPAFDNYILKSRLSTYASGFFASTQLARSEALKRNLPVTLCKSSNGSSCATTGGWEQGWIVLSGSTVIKRQAALIDGYLLSSSSNSLIFQPTGFGSTQATLTVCRSAPLGAEERVLTVLATGRTLVGKTYTGTCS